MKRWRQIVAGTEASEIAEMAMVMPVMFLVFLGIFWAGRSYNIYATINAAAREGARTAVSSSCASCGNAASTDAAVVAAITTSLAADRLNPASVAAPTIVAPNKCGGGGATACPTTGNVAICRNAQLTPPTVTPEVCGVVVQFNYPLDLAQIPLMSAFGNPQIAARAQMKVEQ